MLDTAGAIVESRASEDALSPLHRVLRTMSSAHQVVTRAQDEPTLLSQFCRIACELGYRMAWAGYVENHDPRSLRRVASAGFDCGDLDVTAMAQADTEWGRAAATLAIRGGKSVSIQDFATHFGAAAWRTHAIECDYGSAFSVPLRDDSSAVFGALTVFSERVNAFAADEVQLLEVLAGDLAFGIVALRQRAAWQLAENDRLAHLRVFEGLDRVNRAMQGAADLTQMMRDVLDAVMALFDCDRAFLVYPCDPTAPTWRAPMERNKPAYPGALVLDLELPMTEEIAQASRLLLGSDGPLRFGPGAEFPLPPDVAEQFSIKSFIGMALYPKGGKPWQFGLHQCSHARAWSDSEVRLLNEIGRRLTDGLTSWLTHRDLQQNEGRLRTLVQAIPDLIWLKNPDGVILSCNAQFERLLGVREEDIVGKTDYDFVERELADYFRANDRKAMEAKAPTINEEWLTFAADGYRGLFETIKTPMWDPDGAVVGVLGVARDITARHRADEQLRIAASAFEAQEGILVTDASEVILRVNRAFTEITGYSESECVGQSPRMLRSGRHDADFFRALWDSVKREGGWHGEVWNRRKSGEIYPAWLNITAVRDDSGKSTHYVGTFLDITARKAAEREIEYLAYHDQLTRLPNRRLLVDRLQHALAGSARSRRRGALLFIDLDNFKFVNDTSGHETGDKLLMEVAGRIVARLRQGDTVARLGGDEFVVMLEDLHEGSTEAAAQAIRVGEKLRVALSEPYSIDGRTHHSSPSIGVTLFVGTTDSVDDLLKQADIAMYQAKSAGRNTLRFFDPQMQADLAARAVLEASLRVGVQNGQFTLHFQPQIDSVHGVVGAEALLRWLHPERGMVSPAEFIPVAEETGLILPIGQWVLEAACAQLATWKTRACRRDLQLAINVSARQFRQADFVEQVRRTLERAGAPANRLKIELTESALLHDVSDTIEKMQALRRLGTGFSMDDFGTGYSSLAYLTRLPLDQLKIDQSFVRTLPDSTTDALVVQSIISLAKSLGLSVIAEGVETEAQRLFLDRHGCSTWQGYLFAKPMAIDAFERFVDASDSCATQGTNH